MGAVRCTHSDSRQQIRLNLGMKLIRMDLGMKSILYMWLGIHKYICFIQFIHMGMVRHNWALQK